MKTKNKKRVKNILLITLSNLGDIILTTPVLSVLRREFSDAGIDVLAGPNGAGIFAGHPFVRAFIVYDKFANLRSKGLLIKKLRNNKYDLIVDLRNSLFPILIGSKHRSSVIKKGYSELVHKKDQHLWRLKGLGINTLEAPFCFFVRGQDKDFVENILVGAGVKKDFVVVSPGARSHIKRWTKQGFAIACDRLIGELGVEIVMTGDEEDKKIISEISALMKHKAVDLSSRLSFGQLGALINRARLVITNDSAPMHLGCALGTKVLAIFGPTDPRKYGPVGENDIVIRKQLACAPCEEAQCKKDYECMKLINADEVFEAAKKMLEGMMPAKNCCPAAVKGEDYNRMKRILIVRTDRIGDVVLSTPVIEALRTAYPGSFVAIMVSPAAREIVEGNPYLNEVIVFDKSKFKGFPGAFKFARLLREKKFDTALVLHPTKRAHILIWLAGIPRRVGLNKKYGFLLTDRLPHVKQFGEKHEVEYNLDILRVAGVNAGKNGLFVPVRDSDKLRVRRLLKENGFSDKDEFVVLHPGASCPSKRWSGEGFGLVGDEVSRRFNKKIVIVAGPDDIEFGHKARESMSLGALDLSGDISVGELAALLQKARLLISNDSGPVHIAAALGVPVVAVFGRNQPGLSFKRWGPLGKNDIIIHKEAGCVECLAHNCKAGFKCLSAITPEEVIEAAGRILESQN